MRHVKEDREQSLTLPPFSALINAAYDDIKWRLIQETR